MVSCSSLVSYWMLMKFNSLNLVRKVWMLVSYMGVYGLGGCIRW